MSRRVTIGPPDCFKRAIGAAYGYPLAELPDALPTQPDFEDVWVEWALRVGRRFWFSTDAAPIHLPAWVASVPDAGGSGRSHAVVMSGDRLLLDPNSKPPAIVRGTPVAHTEIELSQIRESKWLMPADADDLMGTFRPLNGAPAGMLAAVSDGRLVRLQVPGRRQPAPHRRRRPKATRGLVG